MAWTRVQGGANYSGAASASSISVTLGATVGSGNAICCLIGWADNGTSISSVTDDKGNTYNLETVVVDSLYVAQYCAASRTNITNAPITITVNFSGSSDFRILLVDEFSGGSTTSSDERDGSAHGGQLQTAPTTGTDATTSGNFTTSVNGDLLWGGTIGSAIASNGTGFSTGTQESTDFGKQTEYRTQTTAGAGTAATFTATVNDHQTTFLIALKPLSGADVLAAQIWL